MRTKLARQRLTNRAAWPSWFTQWMWNGPRLPIVSEPVRGARVVLEGPAEFQVVSDMEAVCGLGKLRVDVPPSAHGFKVLAPNAQVVDLGTAFGMQVRADGQSDMQVLEGQVKMADKASPLRNFNQGQAVHVDGSGQMNEVAPDGKTYLSPAEVERRVNDESRRQFQGWREDPFWHCQPGVMSVWR